jgi:hypothetical protein
MVFLFVVVVLLHLGSGELVCCKDATHTAVSMLLPLRSCCLCCAASAVLPLLCCCLCFCSAAPVASALLPLLPLLCYSCLCCAAASVCCCLCCCERGRVRLMSLAAVSVAVRGVHAPRPRATVQSPSITRSPRMRSSGNASAHTHPHPHLLHINLNDLAFSKSKM